MTWSDIYLFFFIVGFALSVFSFFAGAVHIHLPFRLHFPFQGAHAGGGVHGGGHGPGAHVRGSSGRGGEISWFNASTVMAFLAWFGGTGYLLSDYSHFVALASLGISTGAGLVAGWTVFRFMVKLMHSTDAPMKSEDYRIEGSLGTISMPIRANGTGEIIFSLGGVRRCAGARTDDGQSIEKGAEVVIERYEKGIAYVKRWEEFTK
jgi:membrane protein implicated in regulation of membrane protease activity